MGRLHHVQQFTEMLSCARAPKGLEQALADVSREMGFDVVTMFQHVDLTSVDPSYRHMQRGELLGLTTAAVTWAEHYRDNALVAVDPRVLACRRTVSPFRTDQIGRLIDIGSAQRDVVERQRRADIGDGFTIPVHFPGEPTGSCTFSMKCGRAIPVHNLAMAHWIGILAFEAGRTMLIDTRRRRAGPDVRRLTERQLQCTVLIGRGLGENEIGTRLGISRETVKRHLKEARQSYGVTKTIQVVTRALRDDQITLHDIFDGKDARDGLS
jgi:LuxR family quorum-sensing system transcriptional regulator CciR